MIRAHLFGCLDSKQICLSRTRNHILRAQTQVCRTTSVEFLEAAQMALSSALVPLSSVPLAQDDTRSNYLSHKIVERYYKDDTALRM